MLTMPSPSTGTCYFFGGSHHRTFDGSIVSFTRPGCRHTLVSEPLTDSLRVETQASQVKSTQKERIFPINCHTQNLLKKSTENEADAHQ